MKATFTLTYNPMNVDENSIMESYKNGPAYKSILFELDSWLRSIVKYDSSEEKFTKDEICQQVRNHLWSLIEAENVNID